MSRGGSVSAKQAAARRRKKHKGVKGRRGEAATKEDRGSKMEHRTSNIERPTSNEGRGRKASREDAKPQPKRIEGGESRLRKPFCGHKRSFANEARLLGIAP